MNCGDWYEGTCTMNPWQERHASTSVREDSCHARCLIEFICGVEWLSLSSVLVIRVDAVQDSESVPKTGVAQVILGSINNTHSLYQPRYRLCPKTSTQALTTSRELK